MQSHSSIKAFSLLEVLLCMALLSLMIAVTDLPLRFALHSDAQLSRLDLANRALEDVAVALSVSDYQSAFLSQWQAQLRQAIPGVNLYYQFQTAHTIWVQIDWSPEPGLPSTQHRLQRTVVFV